jgi:hypothetical protein
MAVNGPSAADSYTQQKGNRVSRKAISGRTDRLQTAKARITPASDGSKVCVGPFETIQAMF